MFKKALSKKDGIILCLVLIYVTAQSSMAAGIPQGDMFTNSIGMKFVRIGRGTFRMGQLETLPPEVLPVIEGGDRGGRFDLMADGDYDERPVHKVQISKPFYMGVYEVTNKQYEMFEAGHKDYRGRNGYSKADNEAVIYVNWYDAQAFCDWLSDKEDLPYRLATEAEWEYACRAGSKSNFYTGESLPEIYTKSPHRWKSDMPFLAVGQTPKNEWGLYDMHGNVEEWCYDWYGPYKEQTQADPVGYTNGDFKVTRGGSHSTYGYFLRSANRMGTLPEDKHWLIGFRVVIGGLPGTKPLPLPPKKLYQKNVVERSREEAVKGPDPDEPFFRWYGNFVRIDRSATGPLFAGHNHNPAVTECPNGDLLAIWYTCVSEKDRELAQAASRLVKGREQWQPASPFWDAPDRNDHAPVLWNDGSGKIYHFTTLSIGPAYSNIAIAMRTSSDNGVTWSKARLIVSGHINPKGIHGGHQISEPVFRMHDGSIAITTDGYPTLWVSRNEGLTWRSCEGNINGNHPAITQVADGRILGMCRDKELGRQEVVTRYQDMGKPKLHWARKWLMAKCYSDDKGGSWSCEPSIFPGVGGGQRPVLLRLQDDSIMFAGFADRGFIITDAGGNKREVRGLIAAISEDNGRTWSNVRLVSDDGPGTAVGCTNNGYFCMSQRNAEYRGYLTVCQGQNGLIHLMSSYEHYAFNPKWLRTPAPALKYPPKKVEPVIETFGGIGFDAEGWGHYHGHQGGFTGTGQYRVISKSHFQGLNRLVGKGSFEMKIEAENIKYNPRGPTSSPGLTVWIKDAMMRRLHFYVRDDRLSCGLQDEEDRVPFPEARQNQVKYEQPPDSVKLRFIYNETTRQVRIFYGLNGDDADTELPYSEKGIYFGKRLSESTAAYLLFSNCQMDLDYFEIKPLPELDSE